MTAPVFEEFDPAGDCDCRGCADRRRALAHSLPVRLGGHPAAHGMRRALVLAAAAGTALAAPGAGAAAAAAGHPDAPQPPAAGLPHGARDGVAQVGGPSSGGPEDGRPGTPQGGRGELYGGTGGAPGAPASGAALRPMTRAEIMERANDWVAAGVPYGMDSFWRDGYREDCSGFVSMAWNLGTNEWTGSLAAFGERITKDQLKPGDMLLFHNQQNPEKGSHVTLFGGWSDSTHTSYTAYEQAPPKSRKRNTPYAYWSNSSRYVPYRYKGLTDGAAGAGPTARTAFPGAASFGPGADNAHVTQLGRMLVARGGGRFYASGPGPRWSEADRRATRAFQQAQGWRGAEADGIPGRDTWDLLVTGKGRDIPATRVGAPGAPGTPAASRTPGAAGAPGAPAAPVFPGRGYFRPGQTNAFVTRLGRRLVAKGFGAHYAPGPGPRWSESDRRNVEAFQRAQGWRGRIADGYPGPETWRRLFS